MDLVPSVLHDRWVQFALTLPVMLYTGWPIHRTGWLTMAHRTADMNTLITVGTIAAFTYSLVATALPQLLPGQSNAVYCTALIERVRLRAEFVSAIFLTMCAETHGKAARIGTQRDREARKTPPVRAGFPGLRSVASLAAVKSSGELTIRRARLMLDVRGYRFGSVP